MIFCSNLDCLHESDYNCCGHKDVIDDPWYLLTTPKNPYHVSDNTGIHIHVHNVRSGISYTMNYRWVYVRTKIARPW